MIKFPGKLIYGGTSHCALKYASMKKHPVSDQDLVAMFPTKFSEKWYARRAMNVLVKHGYAKRKEDKIQITMLGDRYLASLAKHYVGEFK